MRLFGKKKEPQVRFGIIREGKTKKWYSFFGVFLEDERTPIPAIVNDGLDGKLKFKVPSGQLEGVRTSGAVVERFFLKTDGSFRDKHGMTFEDWITKAEGVEIFLV